MWRCVLPLSFLAASLFLTGCDAQDGGKESDGYSFFVAGHTYGQPVVDNKGLHPPFVQKFDEIRKHPGMEFGVLTGDIVHHSAHEEWDEVDSQLTELRMPVYKVFGNHDYDSLILHQRYDSTYGSFFHRGDLFILLDPNPAGWSIEGKQLSWLKATVEGMGMEARNVFVFTHQVLWWDSLSPVAESMHPNWLEYREGEPNFKSEVLPLFQDLGKPVFFFAGDVGAMEYSPASAQHREGLITYVTSGMGGEQEGNYLVVRVTEQGKVTLSVEELD